MEAIQLLILFSFSWFLFLIIRFKNPGNKDFLFHVFFITGCRINIGGCVILGYCALVAAIAFTKLCDHPIYLAIER
jgi:hypothetical protein